MNMYSKLQRWSLAALIPCLLAGELAAQRSEAFCALRDPDREIRLLAPAYEKHVSLVRTISKDARSQILEEVPFSIHFDELGQHTLYVVLGEKREVLGYVHVRSESFSWGLVRIAWMMNTNLDITGYRFQRCRSQHRAELESEQTANQLIGKSPKALIAMLTPDGTRLRPGAADVSGGANELMRVMVQSAIKTRVVTGIVWEREVGSVKATSLALRHLAGFARVEEVEGLYDAQRQASLEASGLGESIGFDRSAVLSWSALRKNKRDAGAVFRTPWSAGDMSAKLWWVLGPQGEILAVEDPERSLAPEAMARFTGLIGRTFQSTDECSSASELAALEVSLLLKES